jgi:hypothetical protein
MVVNQLISWVDCVFERDLCLAFFQLYNGMREQPSEKEKTLVHCVTDKYDS